MWPLLSAFLHWVPSVLLRCLHFTLLHACIYQHVLIHSWLPGHECFQLLAVVNVLQSTWVCLDPDEFPFWIRSALYLALEFHSHLAILCLTKSHFLNLGQWPWQQPLLTGAIGT